jgi:DNA mismatch repair ATPase MutS
MLLTGSNASGKSTFLKTIAIVQIFAQTIDTVPANSYKSGFYRVYSSMALRDDLLSKESYFIVEIKSLKRIIDAANNAENSAAGLSGTKMADSAAGERPVMCFVDEVLRGTNTVERIAASSEILENLDRNGVFCFAATHDIELTQLLDKSYENYHFEETIEGEDVCFNYKLCKGRAMSRNAIRLLGMLGYSGEIIERAETRARQFTETGEWK